MDFSIVNFAAETAEKVVTSAAQSHDSSFGAAFAGIAMVGAVGSGIGQGFIAGKAVEATGRNPEAQKKIFKVMIIGAAITETASIYSLIVALLLIFVQ